MLRDLPTVTASFRSSALHRCFRCLLFAVAASACAKGDAATDRPPQVAAVSENRIPDVLATVGDEKITLTDVRGRVGEQLDQLDRQYRRARDKLIGTALDSVIHERLISAESKKTGKTPEELVVAQMGGPAEPTDLEISGWYEENRARTGGRSLDQVRSQIADLLRNARRSEAVTKLDERLKAERPVTIAFEPFRLTLSNEGAPTLGKKDAPVTLVEFSDFQCPYCRAVAPVLKQVAEKFGDQVQIVYRQYPITSIHPFAFKAAEASLCANEQGKFWEMHDAMFGDQQKLAVTDLKATARRLGLNSSKFDTCLDTGRYVEQVQNDSREAQQNGVNGTPAMFINGAYVEGGSVPFSTLETLIRKELSRARPKS